MDYKKLIEASFDAQKNSYAPYSKFNVGASVLTKDGKIYTGANIENASYPAGICAERAAIFAAGAQYPDQPVIALAITARNTKGELIDEPASPCGPCRQVLIETETRFKHPVRILLYGRRCIYIIDGIRQLMPLMFSEF